MFKFLGGLVVFFFVLNLLGIKVSFDTTEIESKTQHVVDESQNTAAYKEFEVYRKQIADEQNAASVVNGQEEERQQTVSEDPAANGEPVSIQDYSDVMNGDQNEQ